MQPILEEDRQSYEFNWLVQAQSAYLKAHETNETNWLEYSSAAFEKARREGKLVFLSIGYIGCEKCKVMARELFDDNEIAKNLNERFVSIKVDRNELPEIAYKFAQMCQKDSNAEEWPLSIFLTPDQDPLYATTFIEKESKNNNLGFRDLMIKIYENYKGGNSSLTDKT